MENRFRLLIFSITTGWTLALGVGSVYLLLQTALWYQSPPASVFLNFIVNYGLISGIIGGLGIAIGLRSLGRMSLLTMLGLTLGWAVSLAIALAIGWFLVGQNPNLLLLATWIGMTLGGKIGGFLTGQVVRQVASIGQEQIWRIAIAWSLSLLVGNGIIYAMVEANRFGLGWVIVGALLGGAITGAIGSRTMMQQISS